MECLFFVAVSLCLGVRIPPAQPPSREYSGSLPTLNKKYRRSPELRHQLAVVLSDLTLESASQGKNAAHFPVYLFWAFSGVTLAHGQMVGLPSHLNPACPFWTN